MFNVQCQFEGNEKKRTIKYCILFLIERIYTKAMKGVLQRKQDIRQFASINSTITWDRWRSLGVHSTSRQIYPEFNDFQKWLAVSSWISFSPKTDKIVRSMLFHSKFNIEIRFVSAQCISHICLFFFSVEV